MKASPFSSPGKTQGRPRESTLTPAQETRYCQLILLANKDAKSGSASMAWRVLCQEFPDIGWDPRERASKHQLPAVARELARKAQALVAFHRQGERGLRSAGISTRGMLRYSDDGSRRLLSGEHVSFDDGTINIPVVIPWTHGGCELSEKYHCKLGRFQLLCPHDEGSSYVPSFEFVIRDSQGYRGPDAGGAVLRFTRDICAPGKFYFEGGVWQGKRMLRILEGAGVDLVSVKGRPWQKMIENFFNRLWTRLAMCQGLASVGRFRGEEKENSEFYVKCRGGKADPRGKFVWLPDLLDGLEQSIRWLNADRLESAVYGKWVPEERWARDMEEQPRSVISGEKMWLAAPVMEKRRVTRNGITVRATGPMGLKMNYQFTGPCLWEWEGKDVEVYFDPLSEWPIYGEVTLPGRAKSLGQVECCNPYADGGRGAEVARSLREVMRREYRLLWSGGKALTTSARETALRGLNGVVEIRTSSADAAIQISDRSGDRILTGREKELPTHDRQCPEPRHPTVAARTTAAGDEGQGSRSVVSPGTSLPCRDVAAEPLRSLSRRAAKASDLALNW